MNEISLEWHCLCVYVTTLAAILFISKLKTRHHLFTCSPAVTYVRQLLDYLTSLGYGTLATLMGRYYAMDRDKRYERTKIAYEGLTKGVGEEVPVDKLIQVRMSVTMACLVV